MCKSRANARCASAPNFSLGVRSVCQSNFSWIVVGEDCDGQNLKYNICSELFDMALAKSGGDKSK